jgi:hypothetical protein
MPIVGLAFASAPTFGWHQSADGILCIYACIRVCAFSGGEAGQLKIKIKLILYSLERTQKKQKIVPDFESSPVDKVTSFLSLNSFLAAHSLPRLLVA